MSKKAKDFHQHISQKEVSDLKQQTEQRLSYARERLNFWIKTVNQLTGSLAACSTILEKSKKNLDSKGQKEN